MQLCPLFFSIEFPLVKICKQRIWWKIVFSEIFWKIIEFISIWAANWSKNAWNRMRTSRRRSFFRKKEIQRTSHTKISTKTPQVRVKLIHRRFDQISVEKIRLQSLELMKDFGSIECFWVRVRVPRIERWNFLKSKAIIFPW